MNFTGLVLTISLPYSVTIISFAGLVTNTVNIIILFKIKSKTDIQRIRLVWCWLVMIYLLFCGIIDTISHYIFNKTVAVCWINLCIGRFLTNVLTITIILVQIVYFYFNYLLITKKRSIWFEKSSSKILLIIMITCFGIIVYSPLLTIWKPVYTESDKKCELKLSKFGQDYGKHFFLAVTMLQGLISSIPLIMFNLMTYYKYKKVLVFSKSNKNIEIL